MRFLLSVVMVLSAAGAFASPWFDTGISSYDFWPTDGSDKVVEGQGTWRATENASLLDSRLKVDTVTGDAALLFAPAVEKSAESAELTYSMTTRFTVSDECPTADPAVKCGVSAFTDGDATSFCGLAKDPSGDANAWVTLSGATPDDTREVTLTIRMKQENGLSYVSYAIDGTPLTSGGEAWLEIADAADMTGAVAFKGSGDVSALSAEVETEAPAVTKALTIPAIENVTVAHVRVAGVDVAPDGEGRYVVEQGSVVTVSFEPRPGFALDVASMTFAVKDDMELPATGRPKAINVAAQITISEVMAKNGVTLRTRNGYEGLDWVELYNSGDEPADLTGWYFYNDSAKDVGKWTKIQGSCVIPARGYKIVWCDKDPVCPDSGFAGDEAYVRFNISTDGDKTIFLATTDGKITTELPLPGGIKDVSYGLGHLSRTVVSANAAAEYRVGAGDWTTVDGPVGMSSAVSDFKVVTYTCNREIANMDQAETVLKDPSAWTEVRTNLHPRIAFAGSNQTVNFPSDLYCGFDTSAVEKFIVVATGTVQVPRSGNWSFDVCSDDGFTASLSRLDRRWSWESRGTRGYQHSTASFNLEAGSYEVKLVYFQNGGGYACDFSAAEGQFTGFDLGKFNLVGTAESGIVHAGALGAEVAADVRDEMVGKSKTLDWRTTFTMDEAPGEGDAFHLLVRYADGFTAKLNGEIVASAAADGARTTAEALQRVSFPVDAKFVKKGENLLEITGENDAVDDTEFYLSAELVHDLANDQFVYFPAPTPGAANVTDGRTGFTPEVTFGTAHGWKDAAFDLELACPGNETAVIYYTLDGTSPKVGAAGTFRYDAPIRIEKTTVVRAAVPDVDSILQVDRSATYLFYEDVIAQGSEPPPGFPENLAVNRQKMLYGMSKVITEGDDDTKARLRRGLTENCRTVSFVIDPKNLFDGASGIFVNASGNGRDWERQTMVEQINPMDPEDEFCVPAGLRIRGAFSRGPEHPKHSFRLFFRSEYGMGTLEHRMFGDEGTDEFEKIDFRTSQNYGWGNGENDDTFIHELWSRDSEGAMGKTYNRTRYYHLFINGTYWGLYMTEERVDDNYAASYNGGTATDYDVIRTSQPGYSTGVTEGEAGAWTELWRLTTQEGYGVAHPENYNRVRGLNPDGTRNENYPILLNAENLIGHVLTAHFAQDSDSPVNGNGMANNIIGFRNRFDGKGKLDGFLWNRHDAEHSLGKGGGYNNVDVIKYGTPEHVGYDQNRNLREIGNFNPNLLHWELMSNEEYRVVFADLVYRHMVKKGGALTAEEGEKRFRARMAEIDDAVVAESARWGYQPNKDGKIPTDHNRAGWLVDCNNCIKFINNRLQYLIPEYKRRGWYPQTRTAALVDGSGVEVAEGATVGANERVHLASPDGGTVYYTTDGSDPRAEGGAPAAGATAYAEGFSIPPAGATIAARVLKDGEWSPLETISVKGEMPKATPAEALRVAEIMSSSKSGNDADDYLVLKNIAEGEVSLDGVKIVAWNAKKSDESKPSLTYAFGDGQCILPGESLKLTNLDKLTNSQVGLRIYDADGALVQDVYVDAGWWNSACDETGASFVAKTFGAGAKTHTDWMPTKTTLAGKVAVAELYTSTAGDGGDAGEYLVLSNLDAKTALDLTDVKIVAWNAKKKSEAEPSLVLTLADLEIPAGGTLTLDQATYFGDGKFANSQVGLKIYDPAGDCAQEVLVDANWWEKACDGTGASFLALEFGPLVNTDSQWTYKLPAPADWPEDPDAEITDETKPSDLGITEGAFAEATTDELKKLAKWAKANEVAFGGAAVNAMAFDADGNPVTVFEEAYLLNCAPTAEAVAAAKAEFKFNAIVPGTEPEITGDFNGTVTVLGSATLGPDADWTANNKDARFYKAVLTR